MYNRQPKNVTLFFRYGGKWWEMVGKWWEFLPKHTKTLFEGDLWTT